MTTTVNTERATDRHPIDVDDYDRTATFMPKDGLLNRLLSHLPRPHGFMEEHKRTLHESRRTNEDADRKLDDIAVKLAKLRLSHLDKQGVRNQTHDA
jgi:hypothetical protein